MLVLFCILAIIIGIAFYAFIVEPRRLKERHFLIRKNKKRVIDISNAYDMFTMQSDVVVAHLSDLHFSRWFKPRRINNLIRSIMETKPDIIVFTGDLIDDYKKWPTKQTNKLIEKLKKLNAPMGKIAVLGNHDYKSDGQFFVQEVLKKAGFTILMNEDVFGSDAKVSMNIAGVTDASSKEANYYYESTLAEWHLLLMHQPDYVDQVKNLEIYDLVLSGHSHGGQIRLPFYRVKTEGAKRYTHSLYLPTKNTLLSVSSGIGTTALPARFGVPPEVVYYHLSNKTEAFEKVEDVLNFSKKTTHRKKEEPTPQAHEAAVPLPVPAPEETPEEPKQAAQKRSHASDKVVDMSLFRRQYKGHRQPRTTAAASGQKQKRTI